jgi:anaerobic selenocysteine-containing dehydrogenase
MPAAALPDDILQPGEGQVRAMMVIAGNPVLSAPGASGSNGHSNRSISCSRSISM